MRPTRILVAALLALLSLAAPALPAGVQTPLLSNPAPAPPAAASSRTVAYEKITPLEFDSAQAAAETVVGRFPGGQTMLFHGMIHEPVTGLAYGRNRWYDPRTGSWLSEDPSGDVDGPNLHAFAGRQPHLGTDPLGLACPECRLPSPHELRAREARRRQAELERLLFETQWFLAENEFASHEAALKGLSHHLVEEGFASPRGYEGLRLAAQLIGPLDCDGSSEVLCHLGGGKAFADRAEWVVVTAASILLPEVALSELAVGGTSYAAMLESLQADVRYAKVLEKHVLQQGEFRGLGIRTRVQFQQHVENVVARPTGMRYFRDGRIAYLDEPTGTVVLENPVSGESTAFQPVDWAEYLTTRLPRRTTPYP